MKATLTHGNETKALILFSLPMIFGNLLQQLYNVADTLIVGRILGASALAAVGSSYALMVLLTSIILGLCMGSGVVFAQLFGAKRMEEMKTSIANAFVFILLVTLVINLAAALLLSRIVVWLQIPPQAMPFTLDYLRVILLGFGFVFLYNFFASVLRSVGNTVVPLLFLGIAALTNILLDLLFIARFGMGIRGAAIATIIAQALSAVCILVYFFTRGRALCPGRANLRFDRALLGRVISNSLLTGIQQSIMNFGILMIQGLVNSFGVAVTAAFAAVVKIDAFAYLPAQDFGNAFATFIAQNHGAAKPQRIRRGTRAAVIVSAVFCAAASAAVALCARGLMLLFILPEETEIIAIGVRYLRIEGACYVGIGLLFLLYGFYRGLGRAGMSIVLTVVSLGSRVLLAYLLSALPGIGLVGIWWSIPIGWLLADLVGFGYCRKHRQQLFADPPGDAKESPI